MGLPRNESLYSLRSRPATWHDHKVMGMGEWAAAAVAAALDGSASTDAADRCLQAAPDAPESMRG